MPKSNFSFLGGKAPDDFMAELEHTTLVKKTERENLLVSEPQKILKRVKDEIDSVAENGKSSLQIQISDLWIGTCRVTPTVDFEDRQTTDENCPCSACKHSCRIAATAQHALRLFGFCGAVVQPCTKRWSRSWGSDVDPYYSVVCHWLPESRYPKPELSCDEINAQVNTKFLLDVAPDQFLTTAQTKTVNAILAIDSQQLLKDVTWEAKLRAYQDGDTGFTKCFRIDGYNKSNFVDHRNEALGHTVAETVQATLLELGFNSCEVGYDKDYKKHPYAPFIVIIKWGAKKAEYEEIRGECVICLEENVPLISIEPCKHQFSCATCVKSIKRCSLCRADVQHIEPAMKRVKRN